MNTNINERSSGIGSGVCTISAEDLITQAALATTPDQIDSLFFQVGVKTVEWCSMSEEDIQDDIAARSGMGEDVDVAFDLALTSLQYNALRVKNSLL